MHLPLMRGQPALFQVQWINENHKLRRKGQHTKKTLLITLPYDLSDCSMYVILQVLSFCQVRMTKTA